MAHSFCDGEADTDALETGMDCCLVESVVTVMVVWSQAKVMSRYI